MKERPDLIKLSKEIFESNKVKGFHNEEASNETLIMLVITELSEAVDADRKGKRFSLEEYEYQTMIECQGWLTKEEKFKNVFERKVKDTLEDELADAVIRLLDLAGLRSIYPEEGYYPPKVNFSTMNFAESVFKIIKWLIISIKLNPVNLINKVFIIEQLSLYLSIDLWLHVELKLEYNKTRPDKHGKAY